MTTVAPTPPHDLDQAPEADEPDGRLTRWFGPMTALRVVVLVVAIAFLAGVVGWTASRKTSDPLSSTDVGFMQDMGYHHDQAVQMALMLLGKDDVSPTLKSFATEILLDQRYEQGMFNAILDRYGYSADAKDEVMGWMGEPIPRDDMPGLATDAQLAELQKAKGRDAEALWIALMTQHHLGGLHMADWEARHGKDATTRNLAHAEVVNQRSEIIDMNNYRIRAKLPIPKGFDDPLKDQRLNPLSFTGSGN